MGAARSLPARSFARFVATACACVALACSQPEPEPGCEVRIAAAALSNGTARSQYLRLEPAEENAVVQVLAAGVPLCSGVLVAERVALTAKHCVARADGQALEIAFGPGDDDVLATTARVLARHPNVDIAALELEQAPGSALDVHPLPIASALPHGLARESLVQLSGFGFDARSLGRRAFLVERIAELTDEHVVVSADGLAGACFGDSGGPLLVRGEDGRARTLGVLSQGSGDCRGDDRYLRVDAVADWLARDAGVPGSDPAAEQRAHPTLGEEGRCFGAIAAWYARGALHGDVCDGDQRCGWDRAAGGHRCISADSDPCAGIDEFGACVDGIATQCARGALSRNPCTTCGFECMRSPKTGLPVCLDLQRSRDGG